MVPAKDTPMPKSDSHSELIVQLQYIVFFMKKTHLNSIAFYNLLSGESFMPVNALLGVFT